MNVKVLNWWCAFCVCMPLWSGLSDDMTGAALSAVGRILVMSTALNCKASPSITPASTTSVTVSTAATTSVKPHKALSIDVTHAPAGIWVQLIVGCPAAAATKSCPQNCCPQAAPEVAQALPREDSAQHKSTTAESEVSLQTTVSLRKADELLL